MQICSPCPNRLPFNQDTILGYLVTIFIETASITALCTTLAAGNILFLGTCVYSKTFLGDLYHIFGEIDEEIRTKRTQMDGVKIRKLLISIVETHNEIFE